MIREQFVAAAVPTDLCWAKNPEGEFLRSAGINKQWVTSAGYFSCVSVSGKYLGQMASAKVLDEFRKLPEEERQPGAVSIPDLKPSEQVIPAPPEGGLVIRVYGRFLARDADQGLRRIRGEDFPQLRGKEADIRYLRFLLEPNTEYMWLTKREWQSLVPVQPTKGDKLAVASAIANRIARFHLSPRRALTSEDGIIALRQVKAARLTLLVEEVTGERIILRLVGFVHHGSDYDETKATSPNGPLGFGFANELHGILEYDRRKERFVRFDIVAPGEVWGRWGDANGNSQTIERPGRSPIGFAFELADGRSPTDRLPPGGHGGRALQAEYFAKEPSPR
ncbi:MAG: hypothetical protein RMJ52_16285 [Gemmataceae bacterium]|nr:hypothetical protein [Gemmataceae bacterium]